MIALISQVDTSVRKVEGEVRENTVNAMNDNEKYKSYEE